MPEVVTLPEHRLAHVSGQGVAEAAAEVEVDHLPAAPAERRRAPGTRKTRTVDGPPLLARDGSRFIPLSRAKESKRARRR